ncbi:hypothetical protein A33M_3342 [Rhodovulum sp. PH10]|nr:hypothetical protein A33M_3342 [Rhodovulum sp. PH10]
MGTEPPPPKPASLVTPEARALADEVAVIAGVGTGQDTPPGWCGAPMTVQSWLGQGASADLIRVAARAAMAGKRDGPPSTIGYFAKPVARELARQSQPLPTVDPPSPGVPHATPGRHRGGFAALYVALSRSDEGGDAGTERPAGHLRAVGRS